MVSNGPSVSRGQFDMYPNINNTAGVALRIANYESIGGKIRDVEKSPDLMFVTFLVMFLLQINYADMLKQVDPLRNELASLESQADENKRRAEDITKVSTASDCPQSLVSAGKQPFRRNRGLQ